MNREGTADDTDVIAAQLASIDAWLALRRVDQAQLLPVQHAGRGRHQELRARAAALDVEAAALRRHCSRSEQQARKHRVVLIHRNAWLAGKISQGLTGLGAHITAIVTDGAVGSGTAIAEAPDLVFLEASLPTFTVASTEVVYGCWW